MSFVVEDSQVTDAEVKYRCELEVTTESGSD
jgi:hypothetical protein